MLLEPLLILNIFDNFSGLDGLFSPGHVMNLQIFICFFLAQLNHH